MPLDASIIVISFNQFPFEILYSVFRYLDIPDILRIRRVSRYLNAFSHCRGVWSDTYRNAEFVRPPGPFPSQCARDLEDALVPSFRVHHSLSQDTGTTQGEKPTIKLREIRYTGVDLRVSLIFGRFLFIALSEEIRCYDLSIDLFDSSSGATIVYRSAGGSLRSFHCVSAIDVEGRPFACAVLSEVTQAGFSTLETTQISIYLVNVDNPSEVTLDLLHQVEYPVFDIDVVNLGPRVIVIRGQVPSPDMDPDWHLIALDVNTRTHFSLPSFTRSTWEADSRANSETLEWTAIEDTLTPPTSISTLTHLLVARSFYAQATGWNTFLQAFTLPLPNDTHHHRPALLSSPLLNPSHQGIIRGINMRDSILLQDAILDLSTQDVFITLRVHAFEPSRPHSPVSKYGFLRLAASPSTSHTSHAFDCGVGLGAVAFNLLGSLGQFSRTPFLHPSFNGAGRVFYTLEPGSNGIVAGLEYDVRGGGAQSPDEHVAKVVEHPSILRFSTPRTLLDYDPYSGRLCLQLTMGKYRVIEILDLAV
ncbi:hypothetical protein JVU11DRAFT_10471 [Chiua virens]|nr:hypothetical protein JVU11DRAFT_10471 [Chiua virens]